MFLLASVCVWARTRASVCACVRERMWDMCVQACVIPGNGYCNAAPNEYGYTHTVLFT